MSGSHRTPIGRRRFVQLMGWAGTVAIAQGGPALTAAAQRSKGAGKPPEPAPTPPPTSGAPEEVAEEARALAQVVRHRYGAHLSAGDLETVTRDLDGDLKNIRRLRETALVNADEPDSTFRA